MSGITTHILDISAGHPASGVSIKLEKETVNGWEVIGQGKTDSDGRLRDLIAPETSLETGNYRLIFETGAYFKEKQIESFYPQVSVAFNVRDAAQHYHVPLLLSPFGYSTYRGS